MEKITYQKFLNLIKWAPVHILSSGLKGIGKNSSPITQHNRDHNNKSLNPNTINNNNGMNNSNNYNYLIYARTGTHTRKKCIRNLIVVSIPAVEADLYPNNMNILQQLQFNNKNILNIPNEYQVISKPVYEPIKNVSALRSVTRIYEKMREPIIDNLKTHTFNNNYVITN